ncbi:MAG TPA: acetolactate synthase small subunit [Deinococcales bacterium]|nr:acetolactate synthase small subunit [Deinococcales bacterium]
MKHLFSAFLRDEPRVLTRVTSLFSRRGFNIDSLAVGGTHEPGVSRMTFVLEAPEETADQVGKQLEKLEDVLSVVRHDPAASVDRELALVKVSVPDAFARHEIRHVADDFRARTVDVSRGSLVLEVTGASSKITAFVEQLRPFGIVECMRTGCVAMERGPGDVDDLLRASDDPRELTA